MGAVARHDGVAAAAARHAAPARGARHGVRARPLWLLSQLRGELEWEFEASVTVEA